MRRQVIESERYYLGSWCLQIGDLPTWVTPEIRDEVLGFWDPLAAERLSVFQPGVLARVRAAVAASPWVRRVEGLEFAHPTRTQPGAVSMRLSLRTPAVLVKRGRDSYLTDAEGVRLGEPYDEAAAGWFRVPLIVGTAGTEPPPLPGEVWQARDVLEGVAVARVLHASGVLVQFPERPIESIDVSNIDGRRSAAASEILLSCGGQTLSWGRSPLSTRGRTLSVPKLIENLRTVLSDPRYWTYDVVALHHEQLVAERRS
jgi:hypothetical protein